jgi:hypothetical protein
MLQKIGFTEEIKQGFLFFLLCAKRPIDEILNPNFSNQNTVFESQFYEMTDETFTYAMFEKIREELVEIIHKSLTQTDKEFLLSFAKANPVWENFNYSNYPAIKWKLLNIENLRAKNQKKHTETVKKLEKLFEKM